MTPAPRQPRSGASSSEAGFTLIELVVSMMLITIGVFAVVQVFYSGLRLSVTSDSRTRASAVASREVEAMRAVAYAQVGMNAALISGSTYADRGHNYDYVTGGTTAPTAAQTVNGTALSIERAIVWAAAGTNTHAYKRCVVVIRWTDTSGPHILRQDAVVYPGGLGPVSSSTTTSSTTSTTAVGNPAPGTPTALTAAADAAFPTSAINLAWTGATPAGTSWEVDHSLDPSFQNSVTVDTANLPIGQTTFQKTGLSAGTTFYFRVRQLGGTANSAWSNVATGVTQSPPQTTCTVGSTNITPAGASKANNGNDALNYPSPPGYLYVSLHTSGICTGLSLRFTPSTATGQVTTPLTAQTGGVWDLRISSSSNYGWDIGIRDLAVVNTSGQVLAHLAFTVCAKNVSPCP